MPYPNEHAARLQSPGQFDRVRRQNDKFGPGRDAIWGIKVGGSPVLQAIRFDASRYTAAQAKQWLKDHDYKTLEFEAATKKAADTSKVEFRREFEIAKLDEPQSVVFGWGSVIEKGGKTVVDVEDDIIEEDELEQAVYEFVLEHRESSERHDPETIGTGRLVESLVLTKEKAKMFGLTQEEGRYGWICGFKVDPEVFQKVQDGKYKAFSIGGLAQREEV